MMSSRKRGPIYTGVSSDLPKRAWEHREKTFPGFTEKYNLHRLVWFRVYDNIADAIADEKRVKRWRREWKVELIEEMNPDWEDLFDRL